MALKINGEVIQLVSPAHDIVIELDNTEDKNQAVEFRLTDTGLSDPAGRFRMRVKGDLLEFQRATSPDWEDAVTLLSIDGNDQSVVLELPEDGRESTLQELLLEFQQLRVLIDLALE